MTSIRGKVHCDKCNNILITQKERVDIYVYKRKLGRIKIYRHYCINCFDKMEEKND